MPKSDRVYSWHEIEAVLAAHHVSYRQFSYWHDRGYLNNRGESPGSGYARPIMWRDVATACVVGDLITIGVHPAKAAVIARAMVDRGQHYWKVVSGRTVLEVRVALEEEPK